MGEGGEWGLLRLGGCVDGTLGLVDVKSVEERSNNRASKHFVRLITRCYRAAHIKRTN